MCATDTMQNLRKHYSHQFTFYRDAVVGKALTNISFIESHLLSVRSYLTRINKADMNERAGREEILNVISCMEDEFENLAKSGVLDVLREYSQLTAAQQVLGAFDLVEDQDEA